MHEQIMSFSSKVFYKANLKANETNAQQSVFPNDKPVEFLDTAGTGFFEAQHPETKSSFNQEESNLVFKHLNAYVAQVLIMVMNYQIPLGIISPYKAQVELITKLKDGWDESDFHFKRNYYSEYD